MFLIVLDLGTQEELSEVVKQPRKQMSFEKEGVINISKCCAEIRTNAHPVLFGRYESFLWRETLNTPLKVLLLQWFP